ncbi:heavy metal-binding domain-containing protein [Enterococcus sp. MJM12]|uniref:Heavy metal-binding domain-containing protein n=1 Tax=Candidatus Enterococcus myersii TaxID=2815322 RepID=A0ABS3H9N4_9ENTE|nr:MULTISPECIES: heavy metal-binding domain-containing protein [Enterococcus]MBO0450170.1 heavy metal-binding domain-containing protein [Enterococcus sp. MJM12]MCD1023852.1 heavy metal-binding domain-containing protein [Enterococcus sp. SMC-9]MDT2739689.1 heavy metal-binding domain-containing protein [Enterococcus canintestini]WHA10168.1 heavy metal-binding domain-containing protein [Enterococcus montenegrensis]
MITSTLSYYPGKKVVKDLGIVYGFDDKLRPVRAVAAVSTYLDQALKDIEKSAEILGANAVLGISFALTDKALPTVMGTAVVLEDA